MQALGPGYITDFGKTISFEGGDGRVNIDRYCVWLPCNGRYQVAESGGDLAVLQAKYQLDDHRVIAPYRK